MSTVIAENMPGMDMVLEFIPEHREKSRCIFAKLIGFLALWVKSAHCV